MQPPRSILFSLIQVHICECVTHIYNASYCRCTCTATLLRPADVTVRFVQLGMQLCVCVSSLQNVLIKFSPVKAA